MARRRVFVLGLDGLDLRHVARLSALGGLPLLEIARERSRLVPLDTSFPSADAAWRTILTGVDPGWHGHFGDGTAPPAPDAVPTLIRLVRNRGDRLKTAKTLDAPIPDPPATGDAGEDAKAIRRLTARALGKLGQAVREWRRPDGGDLIVRIGEVAQALAIETDHADFNHPAGDLRAAAGLSRAVRDLVGDCLGVLAQVAGSATEDELAVCLSPFSIAPAHRVISLADVLSEAGWADRATARGAFVRLRRKGRDEGGVFEDGKETADAARELAAILADIREPVGDTPAIRRVHAAADLYAGDLFDRAPDLICEAFPRYRFAVEKTGEPIRPARRIGRVVGRDHRFGNAAGLLFCHQPLSRGSASPADVARLLLDHLQIDRHPFAEGEEIR